MKQVGAAAGLVASAMTLMLASSVSLFGADRTITGIVVDESGVPLPGVVMRIDLPMKRLSTRTNRKGEYSFSAVPDDAQLVALLPGFKTGVRKTTESREGRLDFTLEPGEASAVSGFVTTPEGALIPGAIAQFENINTGFTLAAQTDGAGHYVANGLSPGRYTVTTTLLGFKPRTLKVQVVKSSLLRTNVTIEPEKKSATITERD